MNDAMTIPLTPLRIGSLAPDFRARSTMGDFQLSTLRGHWVIFFSHPADFTPVCSTEFVALARHQADFDALDCRLVGLSVDSLYAHIAWVRALRDLFDVQIGFPIIEEGWSPGQPTLLPAAESPDAAPDWFCRLEAQP